jgi:S1-C subfamily serine protease
VSDSSDSEHGWQIRPSQDDLAFDLDRALAAMVTLRCHVPEDALTAQALGTERAGNGVVIDDSGLVLTIGYLVTEAESVWITDHRGHVTPGTVAGYDQRTGFGLVQALGRLDLPRIALGESSDVQPADRVVMAGGGGEDQVINALVTARREFAGYWEYLLDDAMFTAPAHPNWGGAGMLDERGRLCGIGSLLVQQVTQSGDTIAGNMVVPIDLLKPILDDLKKFGQSRQPPRPWMGMMIQETTNGLVVGGVYDDCPADRAGIQVGDRLLAVAGESPESLAEFLRRAWSLGPAGTRIPLTLGRDDQVFDTEIESVDRRTLLKSGTVH